MTDPGNAGQLQAQEALLREIRDELRTTRQATTGNSAVSGRPSPSFIAAQQTVDRMVAGNWATLGWANAYQTPIKSSLATDMMGMMGMRAAPQSMWQREYESFAGSMFADRITSFPADLVMPGFGRRSRETGADIYQMSSRFARSGDGHNVNIHAALNMGRDLQMGAATDMRLSGGDYNTILKEGAKAGQFDFAGGLGDVKTQFGELRSAVADLTKTMRMSVGEVAQTMGAFRQFGIVDVADQKRMAERLAATSRVAGVSTPEMAGMVRTGIEGGLQLGLGAGGSAALTENLVMAAREASRTGLISGHVVAAAGGTQGIVMAQQNAINGFAGSSAGFYTALGQVAGSRGGALDDILTGVGATGGSLGGIMSAEARRMDLMGGMSGGQRQRLYNRGLSQQMQMIGVDPNSAEATDYAFSLVRGQMGDAAGLAYARQNFSAEGRKQRWQNAYRSQMEVEQQGAQRQYQMQMENSSMSGLLRQASGESGAFLAGAGRGVGRMAAWLGRGFGGTFDMNSTFGAAHAQALNFDDSLSAEAAIGAFDSAGRNEVAGASREAGIALTGSASGAGWLKTTLGVALGAGGAFAGAKGGAWLGAQLGVSLGPVGVIGGAVAGGLAGAALGATVGAWVGSNGAPTLTADVASNYLGAYRGSTGAINQRSANIASGKSGEMLNRLSSSQSFQKLLKDYTNGGKLSDTSSLELARLAKAAADESGIGSSEDVMGAARAMGIDVEMQETYNMASAGAKRYEKSMIGVMDNVESSKLSIASSEVASGVKAYAAANTDAERNMARSSLTAAGISGRSMDNLVKSVGALSETERKALVEDASSYIKTRGNAVADRRFNTFNQMAQGLAGEAMGTGAGKEAYDRIKEMGTDPRALFDLMLGGGAPKDAALRDFLVTQDDTGTMGKLKELGSMDDLLSSSNDDRFTKTTGLSREALTSLRTAAATGGGSAAEQSAKVRHGAAMMMIGQSSAFKEASDPVNVAASNMLVAANILREIQGKISKETSTQASK